MPEKIKSSFLTVPNLLTLSRLVLAPLFFILFFIHEQSPEKISGLFLFCWIIFGLIELSDLLDGFLARHLKQTSDLGKIMDPFSDAIARITYFICFTQAGIMPFGLLLILVYREIGIGFVRYLALTKKKVMAARITGKIKAWIYALSCVTGLLYLSVKYYDFGLLSGPYFGMLNIATQVSFYLCGLIALISLVDYIIILKRS